MVLALTLSSYAEPSEVEQGNNPKSTNVAEISSVSEKVTIAQINNKTMTPVEELFNLTSSWQIFAAKFIQTTYSEYGEVVENTEGTTIIQRPNLVRWQVVNPYQQILITNDDTLYAYDIELEQIDLQPIDSAQANTPIRLITADLETLDKSFKVEKSTNGNERVFALSPKEDTAMYERIALGFIENELRHLELLDSLGQRTTVVLERFQPAESDIESAFTMEFPEGVDVIDARKR